MLSTNVNVENGSVTAVCVPPDDAEAMADAVRRLLVDIAMRERFGRDGRLRVERMFTLAREAQSINAVYRGLWEAALSGATAAAGRRASGTHR